MDYDFYNPYLLNKLDTIDAEELMATPYAPKNFIVAEMLPEGLTLLCDPGQTRARAASQDPQVRIPNGSHPKQSRRQG